MSNKLNIVAIIPARGGSKGIPKKNLLMLSGKPLIAWSIQQALASRLLDGVYVSSDSGEILSVSESYGSKGIKRPDCLATDTATSESALLHALEVIEAERKGTPDYVVFLQATSPLRTNTDIDQAIETLLSNAGDSLFSCSQLEDFFIWEYQDGQLVSVNYDYQQRLRRQEVKPQYVENGSIYIFKPQILRKHNNRLGGKICLYEMPSWQSLEIDSLEDKDLCEWYLKTKLMPPLKSLFATDIDLIVYDFDGVLTDNRALTMEDGTEGVWVNRSDGLGINQLKELGIPQIILSTESNRVVEARARKVGLPVLYNIQDKRQTLVNYCNECNYALERTLYVGNDVNDLDAMGIVGYPIAPADAHPKIQAIARIVLRSKGGQGVIRELAEQVIQKTT